MIARKTSDAVPYSAGRADVRLVAAALHAQPDAVCVVDAAGRPELMNRPAEALLAAGEGLVLTPRGIRACVEPARRSLAEAIARACTSPEGPAAALAVPRVAGPPLRVLVLPMRADARALALMVVNDPARRRPERTRNLRGYYGLTAAEAETAAGLAHGLSPAQIGEGRGVTLATVRSQIRQTLLKTGARGIPELVALVATAP